MQTATHLKICDFGLARTSHRRDVRSPHYIPRLKYTCRKEDAGIFTEVELVRPASAWRMHTDRSLRPQYVVTRWYRAPELLLSCDGP